MWTAICARACLWKLDLLSPPSADIGSFLLAKRTLVTLGWFRGLHRSSHEIPFRDCLSVIAAVDRIVLGEEVGGSPVLIQLELADSDAVAEKMVAERAEVVIPLKGRPYRKREGRIRDPFGHLWVLSQEVAG